MSVRARFVSHLPCVGVTLVPSKFEVHLLVGFMPQLVIDTSNEVVDNPLLGLDVGLETVDRLRLWRLVTLIEVRIIRRYLVDDSTEVVALGVGVLLTVSGITFYYEQGIIIVMSESRRFPCEDVMSHMSSPPSHHMRHAVHLTAQSHLVYYRHHGIVSRCRSTTDVDRHYIPILYLEYMVVRLHPNLQFPLVIVTDIELSLLIHRASAFLERLEKDVRIIERFLRCVACLLQFIYLIRVEDSISRVTERLYRVYGRL